MTTTQKKDQGNALIANPFNDHSKKELEGLIGFGISSGADFLEIFLESTDNLGILVEQDKVTSVNPSFGKGAGIRVFKGIRDGFVSTNDLSEKGLKEAIIQALGILGIDTNLCGNSNFQGLNELNDYGKNKLDWHLKVPHLDFSTEKLLEATSKMQKNARNLQVRRGSYSRTFQQVLVASSDGTYAKDIRLHQTTGISIIAATKQNRSSVSRRYGTSDKPLDLNEWDVDNSVIDICESAGNMLEAEYVEAGQMPAILANKFGGVIFHEACGHLLETTQIERGTSPFADHLGKQIANPSVTAIDEGSTESAFGSLSMDDEGMVPKNTTLIKDGILKQFLSDRAGELRTGHKRTGSGRRQNYGFAAASRMRNTYISKGDFSPNQLIESVDNGLYCKSMGGGSVGPTGQFNFSVEEGYLIKDGKLTKPVKGATLIGEAKDILKRISMCGDDLDLAPGFCGSVSGNINVTVGQPHIKVDSITVGGR